MFVINQWIHIFYLISITDVILFSELADTAYDSGDISDLDEVIEDTMGWSVLDVDGRETLQAKYH